MGKDQTVTVPQLNPLRQEHCEACQKILRTAPAALELAQACEECGFDVSQEKEAIAAAYSTAKAIQERFFPV